MENNKVIMPESLQRGVINPFFKETESNALPDLGKQYSTAVTLGAWGSEKNFDQKYGSYGVIPRSYNKDTWDETRALNQGLGQKAVRGVTKWAGNTLIYTAGGLGSIAYGITKSIFTGDPSAIFDNEVSRTTMHLSEQLGDRFEHYYSKTWEDKNVFQRATSANFWFDQVGNALAFTTAAVLTETIAAGLTAATGGSLSAAFAANTSRIAMQAKNLFYAGRAKNLATAAKGISNVKTGLSAGQRVSASARFGRQIVTGGMWEGSVEAVHYRIDAENKFLENFRNTEGRDPNQQEVLAFQSDLKRYTTTVGILNTAVVSLSNIITLPKTFGLSRSATAVNRQGLRGSIKRTYEEGKSIYSNAFRDYGKLRKAAIYTSKGIARPLSEAGEETSQGIISGTLTDYILDKHDPANINDVASLWESFAKSTKEQFTSVDGHTEMLIGAIVGGLGGPTFTKPGANGGSKIGIGWQGGVRGAIKEYSELNKRRDEVATQLTEEEGGSEQMKNLRRDLVKMSRIVGLQKKGFDMSHEGRHAEALLTDFEATFQMLSMRKDVGLLDAFIKEQKSMLKDSSAADFAELADLDSSLDEAAINEYKQDIIDNFNFVSSRFSKSMQKANGYLDRIEADDSQKEEFADALATVFFMSETKHKLETEYAQEVSNMIGYSSSALTNYGRLKSELNDLNIDVEKYQALVNEQNELSSYNAENVTSLDRISLNQKRIAEIQKELSVIGKKVKRNKQSTYNNNPDQFLEDLNAFIKVNEDAKNASIEKKSEIQGLLNNLELMYESRMKDYALLNSFPIEKSAQLFEAFSKLDKESAQRAIQSLIGRKVEQALSATEAEAASVGAVKSNEETMSQGENVVEDKAAFDAIVKTLEDNNNKFKVSTKIIRNGNNNETQEEFAFSFNGKEGLLTRGLLANSYTPKGYELSLLDEQFKAVRSYVLSVLTGAKDTSGIANIIPIESRDALKASILNLKKELEGKGYVQFFANRISTIEGVKNNPDPIGSINDIVAVRKDGTVIAIELAFANDQTSEELLNSIIVNDEASKGDKTFLEVSSVEAGINQYTARATFGKSFDGYFILPIQFTTENNVSTATLSSLTSVTPAVEVRNVNGNAVSIASVMPNIAVVSNDPRLINRKAFTLATNISENNPRYAEIQANLQSITLGGKFTPSNLNEKLAFVIKDNEFGDSQPYQPAGFNGTPLYLRSDRFSVDVMYEDKLIGFLRDPLRYVDENNNPYNLADVNKLKEFTSGNNLNASDLAEMKKEYEALTQLFSFLESKRIAGKNALVNLSDIADVLSFDISQTFNSVSYENKKELDGRFEVEIDGDSGVLIFDRNRKPENQKLMFNGEVIDLSDTQSEAYKLFTKAGGVDSANKYQNRYSAIVRINDKYRLVPLTINPLAENEKKDLIDNLIIAIEDFNESEGKNVVAFQDVLKSLENNYFISITTVDGRGINQEVELDLKLKKNKKGLVTKLSFPIPGQPSVELFGLDMEFGEITDLTDIEQFKALLNKKLANTGYKVSEFHMSKEDYDAGSMSSAMAPADINLNFSINPKEASNLIPKKAAVDPKTDEELNKQASSASSFLNKKQKKVEAAAPETKSNVNTEALEQIDRQEVVTDAQYKDFIDKGIVSQARIEIIAEKIKNNEPLTPRELEIFTDKTAEINAELKALEQAETTSNVNTEALEQIKADRKAELDKEVNAVKNAKTKEELIKSSEQLIGINPYDAGAVSMGTRAALMTPGSFDKGKQLFLEEIKRAIDAKYDAELKALKQAENTSNADTKAVEKIEADREAELDNANFSIEGLESEGFDTSGFRNAEKELREYLKTIDGTNPAKTKKQIELESIRDKAIDDTLEKGNKWAQDKINAKYDAKLKALEQAETTSSVNTEALEKIKADRKAELSKLNQKKLDFETMTFKAANPIYQEGMARGGELGKKRAIDAKYDALRDAELAKQKAETQEKPLVVNTTELTPSKAPTLLQEFQRVSEALSVETDNQKSIDLFNELEAINLQLKNENLNSNENNPNDGNDIAEFADELEERNESFEYAKTELQRILGLNPKSIEIISSKFGHNPALVGAFYNSAIYLANKMPKGTAYHEAFHYVFRTILSNQQINSLLNHAKTKYNAPTESDLLALRKAQSKYTTLTDTQLINLFYEEKLAEEFRKYANNQQPISKQNWIQRIWNSIINFIQRVKGKQDVAFDLFNQIYAGKLKGKQPAFNIYTNKTAFAPMLLNKFQGNSVSKFSAEESENFSSLLVSNIINKLSNKYDKSLDEAFDEALTEMAFEYDFTANELLQNQFKSIRLNSDKMKYMNYLLANKTALADSENREMLKKSALDKFKFYGFNNSLLDENYKDNENPERIFDIGPNNILSVNNMSHKTRIYIGSITYKNKNEFGFEEHKAINTQRVFDYLNRGLSNIPKHKIWRTFIHLAKNDVEAGELLSRMKQDVSSELKDNSMLNADDATFSNVNKFAISNIYNMFVSTFHDYRIRNLQILNDYDKNSLFNANAQDVDTMQLKKWATAFEFINRKAGSILPKIDEIKKSFNKINKNNDIDTIVDEISTKAEQLKTQLYNVLGIDISLDYAEYSIVYNNKKQLENYLRDTQDETGLANWYLEKIDLFEDTTTPISMDIIKAFYAASKTGSIYSTKDFEGSVSRLKEIAMSNAIFDNRVYSTTIKNSEGELVNDKVKGNFLIEFFEKFKDNNRYNVKNFESLDSFRKAFPEFDTRDSLVYYRFIKDNALINSEYSDDIFSKQNLIGIISGTRQTSLKSQTESDELVEFNYGTKKDGKNFGKQDSRAKTHTMMAMFAEQKTRTVNGKKVSFAEFILGVNETKNTTWALSMPVKNYSTTNKDKLILEGKLAEAENTTEVGNSFMEDISNLFLKEVRKISEERKLINDSVDTLGTKENPIVKGYNTPDGRAYDLFSFKAWALEYDSKFYEKVVTDPEYFLDKNNLKELYKFAKWIAETEVNDLIEDINEDNINLKEFIPGYYLLEGKISREALLNLTINQLVNVSSFKELLHGDLSYSHKDLVDVAKRAAGTSASGNNVSINESVHNAVVEEFTPIEVTLPNGKIVEIDSSDGQSWGSPLFKMHKLLSEGKLTNQVKEIYIKILAGESITEREATKLAKEGANLNPDKDVYNDGRTYGKMSQFIVTRQLTSRIIDERFRDKLKLDYRFILNKYEDYLSKKVSFEEYSEFTKDKLSRISEVFRPLPGMEKLHNMLNDMDSNFVHVKYTESSFKGIKKNVISNNGELSSDNIFTYQDSYYRKQLETSGFKTKIIDGSQSLFLMWNEQLAEAVATLGGNTTNMKAISDSYKRILAERVQMSYQSKKSQIIDQFGQPKFKELLSSFKSSLEASGVNPFVAEMFDGDTTPNYNLNNLPSIRKFEAMFLNFLSEGVLKQKAAGLKLTLVSGYGFPALKFNQYDETDGNYYSEIYLSEQFKHKFGIKEGDLISDDIIKMLGFRIPTQDKHSMINLKVKKFLPNYYGNAAVLPSEIVYLSGADFDIDSLYVRMKAFFNRKNKQITYGSYVKSENPTEEAFVEYLFDLKENNKEFSKNIEKESIIEEAFEINEEDEAFDKKSIDSIENIFTIAAFKTFGKSLSELQQEFTKKNAKQIDANIKALSKGGNLNNYSPITKAEADNILLDLSLKLAYNDGNKDIALTPADTSAVNSIVDFFENVLDSKNVKKVKHPYSISSMQRTYKSVDDGKAGIGPVAVFNKVFQILNDAKVSINPLSFVNEDGSTIELKSFGDLINLEGQRKNEIISAFLTVMTDNAKDPIAGKLNLNTDNLTLVLSAIGLNMPIIDATMLVNMPSVLKLSNKLSIKGSAISTPLEQRMNYNTIVSEQMAALFTIINKIKTAYNNKTKNDLELQGALSHSLMKDSIKMKEFYLSQSSDKSINEELDANALESLGNFYQANYNAIQMHMELRSVGDALFSFSRILSLDRGTESSFGELYNIDNALEALGIEYNYEKGSLEYDDKKFTMFNSLKLINSNPLVKENLKVFFENRKNSSIFVIKETTPYRKMIKSIKRSIKPKFQNNGDVINKMGNDLLAFTAMLSVKNHNDTVGNNLSNKVEQQVYSKDGKLLFKDELLALKFAKDINSSEGKSKNHFTDNMFLRYIDIENKNGIEFIASNTWTQNSDKFVSEMISAFEQLMNDNKEYTLTLEGQLFKVSPRALAGKLMNYLMFKDAMQYRNGSFIQNASPKLYKSMSNALNRIQESINEGKDLESNFKDMPFNEIVYSMSIRYALEPKNQFDLVYNGNLYQAVTHGNKALKDSDVIRFSDNNSRLDINPTLAEVFEDKIEAYKRLGEQDGFELRTTEVKGKKMLEVNFPVVFKAGSDLFYLSELHQANTAPLSGSNVVNSEGDSFGTAATYSKLEVANNSIFKPYGFTKLSDQLEFNRNINNKYASTKVKNETDTEVTVLEDESMSELPMEASATFESGMFKSNQPLSNEVYEAMGFEQTTENASEIYSKLGSKTKEGNVVIQSVYQTAGVQYAKSIGGVFSLRVNGTNNQFGNPFSSVEAEIQKGSIRTKSTKESVEKYIEWVLSDTTTVKPEQHKFIREILQSGKLKGKPIVYYKELGEPSHATALDYLINKYDWNTKPSTNIKEGVSELFENNPELANSVYEAMGFKEKIKERNNAFTETINNIESSKTGEQVSLHKIFPHISEAFVTKTKENKYYVEHTEDLFTKEELENYLLDNFKPTEKETDVRYLGITSQQKLEAQQAYSNYLNTIFPDSQVKDIVYHGTPYEFDKFLSALRGVNTGKSTTDEKFDSELATFFTDSEYTAHSYSLIGTQEKRLEIASALFKLSISDNMQEDYNILKEKFPEIVSQLKARKEKGLNTKNSIESLQREYSEIMYTDIINMTNYLKTKKDVSTEDRQRVQKEIENLVKKGGFVNNTKRVILNIQNPIIKDFDGQPFVDQPDGTLGAKTELTKLINTAIKNSNDAVIASNIKDPGRSTNYAILDTENAHILGSKQDIQGFKEFVGKLSTNPKQIGLESIPTVEDSGLEVKVTNKVKEIIKRNHSGMSISEEKISEIVSDAIMDDIIFIDSMLESFIKERIC